MIEILFTDIITILTILFIVAVGIQILYYILYLRLALHKPTANNTHVHKPVSVIICAKNEEDNLRKFLPKILEQSYKTFEVIVVNDCSEDNTESYIKLLQQKYKHLKYTFITKDEKFKHNKKLAVTIGIKAAQYDYFVFTDADCYPETKEWLQSIASAFTDSKEIIVGYGGYETEKGLLDKLVRYDTFFSAIHYFTSTLWGMPYMAVGRNMAYSKKIYNASSKFSNHYHIKSGDDDLFMIEMARAGNTQIEISGKGYTRSKQVQSFAAWISQKTRHLSTSSSYKWHHKLWLGLEPLSRVIMYGSLVLYSLLNYAFAPEIIYSLLLARIILQLIIFKILTKRLHEEKILVSSLLFDIAMPIIMAWLIIRNKFNTYKKR